METPLSPNDFYDYANTTIVEMRLAGMNKEAEHLDFLLHKVAWTTGDELTVELGQAILKFLDWPNLSAPIRSRLQNFLAGIQVIWPGIGGDPMRLHRRIRMRDQKENPGGPPAL